MAKMIPLTGPASSIGRRGLMAATALGALVGGSATPRAEAVRTSARIVIAGAGAAGLAMAARLAARLEGATITLIDRRQAHL
jgi:sulfide:quinone oxidoreductase